MTTNTTPTAPDLATFIRTRNTIEQDICHRLIAEFNDNGLPAHQFSRMLRLARRHNITI